MMFATVPGSGILKQICDAMGYKYCLLIGKLSILSGHIITTSSMYAEQSTHLAMGGGAGEVIM